MLKEILTVTAACIGLFACVESTNTEVKQSNITGKNSHRVSKSNNPKYISLAGYVGRIGFDGHRQSGNVPDKCTGTLLGSSTIITANHCFGGQPTLANIQFGAVTIDTGQTRHIELSTTKRLGNRLPETVDVAIVRINGAPIVTKRSFEARMPRKGEALYIIHHPKGGLSEVSERGCKVIDVKEFHFWHDCTTELGSSGALVFADHDDAVVGIHTNGPNQGAFSHLVRYNKGTTMNAVLAVEPDLRRFFDRQEAIGIPTTETEGQREISHIQSNTMAAASVSTDPAPFPKLPHSSAVERRLANNSFSKTLVVQAGQETQINLHSRWQRDCSYELPKIAFPFAPDHGQVRAEIITTRYGAENAPPSSKGDLRGCNGRTVKYVHIYYDPAPGFVGTDTFSYDRITGDRFDKRYHFNIIVR